ncbi:MAG: hypothetical protein N3F67_01925 [Acidilobaceae archaeon]|nr:hypothetical protein [Acidilobaceae archaeon]
MEKDLAKVLLFALLLRLAIAPFSAHLWDVAMIQESLYLTVSGENVYKFVYEKSVRLQNATGLPLFFEGYAYPPHLMVIMLPYYLLYLSLGGDPRPIKIESDAALSLVPEEGFVASVDVFLFLLIIKAPLIGADLVITYLLWNRRRELAALYAFSPYVILISAAWGMFDGLVALCLLLAILFAERGALVLSGLAYGLSLMKPYSLLALPPFIAFAFRKGPRALAGFSLGFLASQLPTLAYLLLSPQEFFHVTLLFHSLRPPSGLTPLKALSFAEDSRLTFLLNLYFIAFVLTYLFMLTAIVRRGVGLQESVLASLSFFLAFGKVVHEQYYLSLFPLALLCQERKARALEALFLLYLTVNSALYLLSLPLLFVMDYGVLLAKQEITYYGLGSYALSAIYPVVLFFLSVVNVYLNLKLILELVSQEEKCEAKFRGKHI